MVSVSTLHPRTGINLVNHLGLGIKIQIRLVLLLWQSGALPLHLISCCCTVVLLESEFSDGHVEWVMFGSGRAGHQAPGGSG